MRLVHATHANAQGAEVHVGRPAPCHALTLGPPGNGLLTVKVLKLPLVLSVPFHHTWHQQHVT